MGAQISRDQHWFACRLLRENYTLSVPYYFIGKISGIDEDTVKYHHKWYETVGRIAGCNDCPPLVTEEHREELVQRIVEADERGIPWNLGR
jgi:hypothetical protein